MTPIAPLITDFLRNYLPVERGYSPHTCDSYAYAFRLLFLFAAERLGSRPSQLHLEHLDASLIVAFLTSLRRSIVAAARPAATSVWQLKRVHRYIELSASGCAGPSPADPRHPLQAPSQLRSCIQACASRRRSLPRSGGTLISPHQLRHSCALIMLQATRDIRKVALWLGHADVRTTEVYLRVDPTEKLEAVEAVLPPQLRRGRFAPPDRVATGAGIMRSDQHLKCYP